MSYFSSQALAVGYAKQRPYFHPLVLNKVRAYLHLESTVQRALDVGCGAGLLTIALAHLADQTIGIDSSQEMINAALQQENVQYYTCPAEQLPFQAESFQLITVCGALNWINRSQFLPAAKRVLAPTGWLIIYDNLFYGRMREQPAFADWYTHDFLTSYPKPPRDERPLSAAECHIYGLHFAYAETYTNDIRYALDQCIDYLMTHSNISVVLTQGRDTEPNIRAWLARSMTPFFDSTPKTLMYGGYIWYLQPV
jgi:SAM-dependent methyltransferase